MPTPSASEPLTPDPALVARFRDDLEALTGEPPSPERRLGVAVSGGADSLALLLLAHAAYPGTVVAATVDHGLRADSAEEAATVSRLCAALAISHAVLDVGRYLRPLIESGIEGCPVGPRNLQAAARSARYAALREWAWPVPANMTPRVWREWEARGPSHAHWVATGHQRDDVAEGLLMRARRGAGVGGLAEMPRLTRHPGSSKTFVVRPLLEWARADLARIVAGAGLAAVSDPSNGDAQFDRSRMRALLAANAELPAARLAMTARNLRHAEEALDWAADAALDERMTANGDGLVRLDALGLPYEIVRRLTAAAITIAREEGARPGPWERRGLDRLVRALLAGRGGTLAGIQAIVVGEDWHFRPEPPRRT